MAGYIGSKTSVTQVDGYNRTEADDEFVSKDGDTITTAGTTLTLDRTGSEGTILDLKKDGSTVGSIGVASAEFYHGSAVGGDTFLRSGYSTIVPATSAGANRDNAINLGSSVSRFKDLWLSGGVYLGGTGSANYLDDYEEGTWTPSVEYGSITYGSATYTKVGRTVTLHLNSYTFTDYTTNNFIRISGLPFSPGGVSAVGSLMSCRRDNSNAISPYIPATVSQIRFYLNSTTGGFTESRHNMFNDSTNQTYMTITYQTA